MASRKNRSGKANRRSPKPASGAADRLRRLGTAAVAWIDAHRWHSIAVGMLLLFTGSLMVGYWLAERLEMKDGDRLARDTLEEMKRGASTDSGPRYARIEDIPGLPQYTDAEPGRPRSKRAWELPGPLTMSFLPYAKDLGEQARSARGRGQELMLHLPMEPSGRNDPGPNALLVSLTDAELRQRTQTALDSFEGYAGVNNHMGSRFTAFRPGMETVLRQFRSRGLMFLDSRTTPQSVGDQG